MDTHEVLDLAADIIEEQGWTQGPDGWPDNPDDTGPVCIEGALTRAMGLDYFADCAKVVESPAMRVLSAHLGRALIHPFEWNDQEGRTAEEVIAALREAADLERHRAAELAAQELVSA